MEPKIGVYVCHCGTNIAGTVDVEAVAEFAATLPNVAVARHYMYMCSDPGQDLIRQDIKEMGLNRVVVASCSPTDTARANLPAGLPGVWLEPLFIRDG